MSDRFGWLPHLVPLSNYGGDWQAYEAALLKLFDLEYLVELPRLSTHEVRITCTPLVKSVNPTFWHIITTTRWEGDAQEDRIRKQSRCERILWPKAILKAMSEVLAKTAAHPVKYWANERQGEKQILVALDDFSYLVVLKLRADAKSGKKYLVLWTAYDVEFASQRRKLERECEKYWAARGTP